MRGFFLRGGGLLGGAFLGRAFPDIMLRCVAFRGEGGGGMFFSGRGSLFSRVILFSGVICFLGGGAGAHTET